MKRIVFVGILCFFNKFIFGQISTIDEAPKSIAAPPIYDSSFFDTNQNVKMYIGLEIYIVPFNKKYNPDPENSFEKPKAYEGFMKDTIRLKNYDRTSIHYEYTCKNIYKLDSVNSNIENCDDNPFTFYSTADALSGKTFKVIDAKNLAIEADYLPTHPFYLQLMSEDKRDTFYFYYPIREYANIPFYFIATYKKLEKQFKGKTLVKKTDWGSSDTKRDIKSGLKIKMRANSKWKCIDVAFINPIDIDNNIVQQQLGIVLVNDISEEIFLPCGDNSELDAIFREFAFNDKLILESKNWIQSQKIDSQKKEQQKIALIQKYGIKYGNLIADHRIEIGMTKEMCEMAWGKPTKVDKITTPDGIMEFWSYYFNSFLSFRDGKLIIIKE